MKQAVALFLMINLSFPSISNEVYLGETYEYASPGKKTKAMKLGYKTVFTPIKFAHKGKSKLFHKIHSIAREIKLILKRHDPKYKHNRPLITGGLKAWEDTLKHESLQPQYSGIGKKKFLLYFPHKAVDILKETFVTFGIELPITIFHFIEGAIKGGLNSLNDKSS